MFSNDGIAVALTKAEKQQKRTTRSNDGTAVALTKAEKQKKRTARSVASLFISGAGTAHGVEETSPLHVVEVIETEPTPESSSVVLEPESSTVLEPESSTALEPESSTIGLVMMGGQFDTNADFARLGGKTDATGSFFGQLRHERERLSAQASYYKNLNNRYTGNDLDLLILQPGIKFRPSSTITLIPSLKLDATWLNRTEQPFYRSYGINLLVNFEEGLLSNLNFDVAFRDFKRGKDDYNTNFSGTLTKESLLVEGDTLSLRPYVLTNFAYSGSSDIAVRPKYLQGGVNASYTYPVMENVSVEPMASVYFRPYKIVKGGIRDDTNTVFGLSVSIDEFIFPNQTLTAGYGHEENHSTVRTDNYINDSFTIEVLWLFF
ncbi:MAG: hypothetical protein QGG38_04900 [Nitrospinaceae bacterium]|nr:hypothetical protein [Nitrospinaceae bacterium]